MADRKFLEREGADQLLLRSTAATTTTSSIYGAMFLGQPEPALEAADELDATLPEELLRIEVPPMADWLEGFVPMQHARADPLRHVGSEIMAEPFPDDTASSTA